MPSRKTNDHTAHGLELCYGLEQGRLDYQKGDIQYNVTVDRSKAYRRRLVPNAYHLRSSTFHSCFTGTETHKDEKFTDMTLVLREQVSYDKFKEPNSFSRNGLTMVIES